MSSLLAIDEVEQAFFERPVEVVARDLVGRRLRVRGANCNDVLALILETEAYGDASDPASHAAFRPGGRAAVMAAGPGIVYVYAAYGMYPCFNIVTGPEGLASAVLLRGVWRDGDSAAVYGPGRTTRLLEIASKDHGRRIPGPRFGVSNQRANLAIETTPRIGIRRGVDTLWRFVAKLER